MDVKHNRSKNGSEDSFIISKKTIDNPNTTILIKEEYPKIDVTYIARKKKHKDSEMNFTIKMLVEIEVAGHKHIAKV